MECSKSNIKVFIGDFGMAMDANRSSTRWAGTDTYFAPEVDRLYREQTTYPFRQTTGSFIPAEADLYSMALILQEVFGNDDVAKEVLRAQAKDRRRAIEKIFHELA